MLPIAAAFFVFFATLLSASTIIQVIVTDKIDFSYPILDTLNDFSIRVMKKVLDIN